MKIVVTEPQFMGETVRASLARLGEVSLGPFDDRDLEQALAEADVLMVRLGRFVGAALFAKAPKLRVVVTATTGLDHIDLDAAKAAGIRVISLRDCPGAIKDVSATAELTIGLMLALLRHIPGAAAHVLGGGWDRSRFFGTQLRGKRLGIIGYGRIGAMVARSAHALGMEVVACDRNLAAVTDPARPMSFDELLETCDVVSIHVTGVPENRGLLDGRAIRRMRPGAVLINTARGSVVDEAALAAAVEDGRLSGVAVDVVNREELGEAHTSPLLACARKGRNVLMTPHIGGATHEAIAQAEAAVISVLDAVLQDARDANALGVRA